MTTSMNNTAKEEAPTGELRKDSEGKGYWHSYKNDKKKKKVEEVTVEEVKADVQPQQRRRK